MNRLSGIVNVTFDLESKVATVIYNPQQVSAETVQKVLGEASAKLEEENTPTSDVQRLLGPEPRDQNS